MGIGNVAPMLGALQATPILNHGWVPACAGMTAERAGGIPICNRPGQQANAVPQIGIQIYVDSVLVGSAPLVTGGFANLNLIGAPAGIFNSISVTSTGVPASPDPNFGTISINASSAFVVGTILTLGMWPSAKQLLSRRHLMLGAWRPIHLGRYSMSLPHFHCFLKRRCGILRLLDKHLCRRQPKSPGFQHPSLRPWFCSVWVSSASAW